MLSTATPTAFVATTDLARAKDFFAGTLGLELREVNGFAVSLTAGPIELRVTLVESLSPAPYTVFGWQVADIAATVDQLAERGVEFLRFPGMDQDTRGVWQAPGG